MITNSTERNGIRCVLCTDASVCFLLCLAFRPLSGVFSPASPSIRFHAGVWIQTIRSMDEIYFFKGRTGRMSLLRSTMTVGSVGDGLVCHQLAEWASNDRCLRSKSPVYEPKFACPVHCFLMDLFPPAIENLFRGPGFCSGQSTEYGNTYYYYMRCFGMTLATLVFALWGNSQVPTGLPGPILTGNLTCSAHLNCEKTTIIISGLEGIDPLILPMVNSTQGNWLSEGGTLPICVGRLSIVSIFLPA